MTAASAFVTEFHHLATECGLDIDQMLQDAGIDRSVVDSPDTRVSNESLARLVVDVWDRLQDEAMGQSENGIPRGAFHMMGKVAVGELNLRRALLQSAKFYAMVTDAYRVTLEESGEFAILRFDMKSSQHSRYKLFAEITLMAWHRMACWLIGEKSCCMTFSLTIRRLRIWPSTPTSIRVVTCLRRTFSGSPSAGRFSNGK